MEVGPYLTRKTIMIGFPKKMWMGWWIGEVRSIQLVFFFIIIRRCDIGVVLHLLGQFAKNRSRCIFIDGSITPCLWGWDSHTPNRRINRFIFEDCVWAQSKPWYRLWSPLSFHCYVNFFIKI